VRTFRLGHAVVETEELCRVVHTGQPQRFPIRPVLDDDFDVVQFFPKFGGQFVEGMGHEALESVSVHGCS
jgi:hypothetical protein